MSTNFTYISLENKTEHEILRYYDCPIEYCDATNLTPLELQHHINDKHYRCAIIRILAKLWVRETDRKREQL